MIELLRECREVLLDGDYLAQIAMAERIQAALAGKDAEQNAAPQARELPRNSSVETPSASRAAGAAPGLPEEPDIKFLDHTWPEAASAWTQYADELRTFALRAVEQRDEAWAALRDAQSFVNIENHRAIIAAARRGG